MSKIVILGDTHFGARSDSLDFHNHFKKFYDTVFFPYLKENNIQKVFQLGDLFDRRKFINYSSLFFCRKYFFDQLKKNNIELHTLIGNHDIYYRNTLAVNSPELILGDYDNVKIYSESVTIDEAGISIDIIPWICSDNENEVFDFIKRSKSEICFGHFEIDGFAMDRGNIHRGGLDRKELKRYDVVLSGHFHHKSFADNITYVGTPYEMTWSDYRDPKGFHVFDTTTRNMEFVSNPYVMFNKVFYDDVETDFEYWKKFDYESLKETYVKLVVLNKQNPYLFDSVLDNLYKVGLSDLNIVEDFTEVAIEDDQHLIDQAEDPMTILSKYIDNMALDIESKKLKNIMREVYIEALNTENT